MRKLTRCLISICLMLAGYASIDTVAADTLSMSAFAREAAEKARECHRAAHDSRKAGQRDTQRADECTAACRQASILYKRQGEGQKRQRAQMERCTQVYNNYKSPESAPVEEEITMPTTVEEMATRMSAMKSKGRLKNDPCVAGVNAIHHRQFGLEQAKHYWEGCVRNYKSRMQAKRLYGR